MPQSVPTAAEFNSLAASVQAISDRVTVIKQGLDNLIMMTDSSLKMVWTKVNALEDRVKKLETPVSPPSNILLEDKFDRTYILTDGAKSPDGKWKLKYTSGGKVESANGLMTMYPKTVTSADQTASTLLMTTATFKDFQLDFDAKLNKQTRTGSTPNSWESWWIFWSYNDEAEGPLGRSNHHYYFVLKTNGWEFGKKDNAVGDVQNEQQIFIKTANMPVVKIGVSNHITILKKGFHFIIKVDGITVVDQDDSPNDPIRMAQGLIGLYEEDANVSFDNVKVITA